MERNTRFLAAFSVQSGLSAGRRAVSGLAMPPICTGCERQLDMTGDAVLLCESCRRCFELPPGPICPRCAAPAPAPSIGPKGCVHCATTPFHFQHVAALGVYRGPMQSFVLRMKSANGEALAMTAGRLLAQQIRQLDWNQPTNVVTATPMHWIRRLWRGVNDAALLAEVVAEELRLPLRLSLVRATRRVARQATLTPSRRRHNLRGVFRINRLHNLRDAHVLLIDDVLTTGTTANSIARVLKEAGAASVCVGVVARGIGAT